MAAQAVRATVFESGSDMQHQPTTKRRTKRNAPATPWHKKLGPGLISGAADDDPSGIATYSQGGAQFGYQLLWTLFFTYPLMVGIQIVSARIGRVTGEGLAGNIRRHYPAWLLYAIVGMLLVANTINIGADIAAMADAVRLLVGGPHALYVIGFGVISVLLQDFIPYRRYVSVLKWLTLALQVSPVAKHTKSAPIRLICACRASSSGKQFRWVQPKKKSKPRPTSSRDRKRRIMSR